MVVHDVWGWGRWWWWWCGIWSLGRRQGTVGFNAGVAAMMLTLTKKSCVRWRLEVVRGRLQRWGRGGSRISLNRSVDLENSLNRSAGVWGRRCTATIDECDDRWWGVERRCLVVRRHMVVGRQGVVRREVVVVQPRW